MSEAKEGITPTTGPAPNSGGQPNDGPAPGRPGPLPAPHGKVDTTSLLELKRRIMGQAAKPKEPPLRVGVERKREGGKSLLAKRGQLTGQEPNSGKPEAADGSPEKGPNPDVLIDTEMAKQRPDLEFVCGSPDRAYVDCGMELKGRRSPFLVTKSKSKEEYDVRGS